MMKNSIPRSNDLRAKDLLGSAALNHLAPGMTYTDIAKRFGISKGRAYQLCLSAIAKIRQAVLEDPELRDLAEEICGHRIHD